MWDCRGVADSPADGGAGVGRVADTRGPDFGRWLIAHTPETPEARRPRQTVAVPKRVSAHSAGPVQDRR